MIMNGCVWKLSVFTGGAVANILVLNTIIPYPANYNGNAIRVFPLGRRLALHHQCYLAAFGSDDERYQDLRRTGVYKDILLLPARPPGGSRRRYFSLRSGHLARISQPDYFQLVTRQLRAFVEKHNIELVMAHTVQVAEFAEALRGLPMIMDQIDCRYLSQQRKVGAGAAKRTWRKRLDEAVILFRAADQEGKLTQAFRYVTTVSPVDRRVLQELSKKGSERILDIPNGISPELENYLIHDNGMERAIAFWGALDFPPNRSAVLWFYKRVYLPFLADKDIKWYIIGRNAGAEIREMATAHVNIIAPGFVEDLYGLASRIPVMINPMKMGGGLKNKVLEAFALERVVVSNALGVEAIDASPGVHYVQAESPDEFAEAVIKYTVPDDAGKKIAREAHRLVLNSYTWEVVGSRFEHLIDAALNQASSDRAKMRAAP